MAETIREMIIPGTYIEVRSEGLIGVGGISTGNVGVVGTASRGPVNEVRLLGSYAEAQDLFGGYDAWPASGQDDALTLMRTLEQVFKGGASSVYAVRIAEVGSGSVATGTWAVKVGSTTAFTLTASSPGTWANEVVVTVALADDGGSSTLKVALGKAAETFTATDAEKLMAAVNEGSRLVTAGTLVAAQKANKPTTATYGTVVPGNGQDFTAATVAGGLALLATEPVNILVGGGLDVAGAGAAVLAHLEATENDGRERIAVMGTASDVPATIAASVPGSPRLVLVTPGIVATDAPTGRQVKLPAGYAAALVAGRMSTLAPHVSLTNKDVAAEELTRHYTRAEQKALLAARVLVLHKSMGIRVLKGTTTDDGAFKQVSVRRVVDYAKAGVRAGSNPYIGRLNNARVRAALQATLDGFLSSMVLDEMLTAYELSVTATRRQEIEGTALVTLTLQPTFSIDFVKVIMNLQ